MPQSDISKRKDVNTVILSVDFVIDLPVVNQSLRKGYKQRRGYFRQATLTPHPTLTT